MGREVRAEVDGRGGVLVRDPEVAEIVVRGLRRIETTLATQPIICFLRPTKRGKRGCSRISPAVTNQDSETSDSRRKRIGKANDAESFPF